MEKLKAMILCGGYGTRLHRETEFRPKPLVEIGSRPILWQIMKISPTTACAICPLPGLSRRESRSFS
jgi:choline kinase